MRRCFTNLGLASRPLPFLKGMAADAVWPGQRQILLQPTERRIKEMFNEAEGVMRRVARFR